MTEIMYDVLIIGGGISALSAALYAGKKGLAVGVITDSIGGQLVMRGTAEHMSFLGNDGTLIMQSAYKAAQEHGVEIISPHSLVQKVSFRQENNKEIFVVEGKDGVLYEARSIIVASGRRGRKLGIPGEEQFAGKGLSYYLSLDKASLKGKIVGIIGGGNTGIALAIQLSGAVKRLVVMEKTEKNTGDPEMQDILIKKGKITSIVNADVKEIIGKDILEKVAYEDKTTKEIKEIVLDEVIVSIGFIPNSEFVKELCELNQWGEIVVSPRTNATSHIGIFAAGDVTDSADKEAPIAAGNGANAGLQCAKWLKANA